ncbi:TPA: phage tail protein [Citrobacter farmeri]|uniref:Phage tail protein n=1 Tax=Citrobacter farmeri TaxID=67824 RepID=A0ACA8D1Z2_9ENTR|nr:phage tail protein [Citrobacter farmeri]HAT2751412.1 phage tail protein [Citrobacter farmeri]HBI2992659.1 phage tail protein [Citrobacter farmeri]HBI3001686.1 phage tail protein [Citrobacter farmeri]HBI3005316.1 phage tail protein [Citrobacter farmeri]
MSAKFYTLLTDIGAAKLASAAALGVPLKITQMAVGDGGGVLPTPSAQQTALVAEKRRAALNMLYIDPQNSSQIIAEQVIPETEGGWWIREVGLFDDTGALIAVGNCPESYKPQLAEGSGRTQTVRMVLITSSTDNITLKVDPAVVLATRKYVDDKVLELKVYVDDLMAKHVAANDPHTQYAPKASPSFTGTPKAPTAAAGNNSTQLANTAFVQAAIAALVASSPAALDTLNELAAALGNDPNFATTMTNALAGKMDRAANGKDIADVSEFLKNLHLAEAGNTISKLALIGNTKTDNDKCAVIVKTGSNANGKYRIWSDGSIDMWGNGIANVNGDALVNYPIALPAAAQNVTTTPLVVSTATNRPTTSVMAVTDLTTATKATFIVKRSDGSTSADGFYWSVNYAAF